MFNNKAVFGEYPFMMDGVSSLNYHISNGNIFSNDGSSLAGFPIIHISENQ